MAKGIEQVRRSIKKRKKHQFIGVEKQGENSYPVIHEEEKHGMNVPLVYQYPLKTKKGTRQNKFNFMPVKLLVSVLLFIGSFVIYQKEQQSFSTSQQWLYKQLNEEFPFAKVQRWYVDTLGDPLSITPTISRPNMTVNHQFLPINGQVVEAFRENGRGIKISPSKKTSVSTLKDGVVVFVGNKEGTRQTVIVQHADGSNSTYGFLSEMNVHLYETVQANQNIGTFSPTKENDSVYYSIEKDNQYLDPEQVIPVDDIP